MADILPAREKANLLGHGLGALLEVATTLTTAKVPEHVAEARMISA